MALDLVFTGEISRTQPQAGIDHTESGAMRMSRYDEPYMLQSMSSKHVVADEGAYFTGMNGTIGTGLAYGVITAHSDTASMFILHNNSALGDPMAKRVYLDYIKIVPTVAPASATSGQYALRIDSTTRAPTANSVQITPYNPNMDSSSPTVARLWAASGGTLTTPASSGAVRNVARGCIRSVIPAIGDELVIACGVQDIPGGVSGANARVVSNAAPIILGPQQYLQVSVWFPANAVTALSYEFDMGWWER